MTSECLISGVESAYKRMRRLKFQYNVWKVLRMNWGLGMRISLPRRRLLIYAKEMQIRKSHFLPQDLLFLLLLSLENRLLIEKLFFICTYNPSSASSSSYVVNLGIHPLEKYLRKSLFPLHGILFKTICQRNKIPNNFQNFFGC